MLSSPNIIYCTSDIHKILCRIIINKAICIYKLYTHFTKSKKFCVKIKVKESFLLTYFFVSPLVALVLRLTDWLTDLAKGEKTYSGQTLKRVSGSKSPDSTSLDLVYLKGDMEIEVKNHHPFYSDQCANLVGNLDEKKYAKYL